MSEAIKNYELTLIAGKMDAKIYVSKNIMCENEKSAIEWTYVKLICFAINHITKHSSIYAYRFNFMHKISWHTQTNG